MASNQNTEERLKSALADRYVIERQIGTGGMSTVYLAKDLKHNRNVAVKVLDPGLAEALGAERFLREIETAANLTHPHILPLHDSGKADGFLFYVMPFMKGESLRARLTKERQLPVEDAVQVTREIADALAYAHQEGVVHRDVKPANIMLEAGHAVLADFGVAQAVAEAKDERLSRTGTSLGTPAYMSPEQASGERDLDGRCDQYALGCVLFEMLAGHPPFTGAQVEAVVRQHLTQAPPSVTQARPSVPEEVARAIERALSKSPADRFKTTGEMAAALALTTGPVQKQKKALLPPRWMGLAAAAVVFIVAGAYFGLIRGDAGMALLPGDLVAVFPFENLTGDPELDELGKITAYHITLGLTLVDGVRVRSADAVSGAMLNASSGSTKEELALGLGAGVIVTGIITPEGESLQYHASITRVSSGEVLTPIEVLGARDEEGRMGGPDELRQRIMGALAGALNAEFPVTFGSSRPPSYDAYQAFMRGLERFVAGEFSAAIPFLDEAHALDSTFFSPLLTVGGALYNLGRWAAADSVLTILRSRRAEMTPTDRLQLDYLTAGAEGDIERTLEPLRLLSRQDPGWAGILANSALSAGRPQEALDALEESLSIIRGGGPVGATSLSMVALANLHLGRYEAALDAIREARSLSPKTAPLWVRDLEIGALAGLGRLDEIVSTLDEVGGMEPGVGILEKSPGQVFQHAAAALARAGYHEEARETADRAVRWYRTWDAEGNKTSIGLALLQADRPEEALGLFQQLVEGNAEVISYRGYRGIALARTGDTASAEVELSWLAGVVEVRPRGDPTYFRAAILGHLGRNDEAVRVLHQSIQEGHSYWYQQVGPLLWTDPLFEPLWGYEPFERVVGPQG